MKDLNATSSRFPDARKKNIQISDLIVRTVSNYITFNVDSSRWFTDVGVVNRTGDHFYTG
jgi:hypothetical protein